ncbi:MAG TPA: ATP-binding protein, partial [Opitutaceae bacterium]
MRLLVAIALPAIAISTPAATETKEGLSDSELGMLAIRAFKPRDYHGSAVCARILEHPQTGELLLLAGTLLHIFNGVTWTAVQTNTPAIRCLGVDAEGRVWLGGVDELGYCARDAKGAWSFTPLADKLPEAHRKIGRIWDCVVMRDAVWFGTETKALRWQGGAFSVFEFPSTGTLLGVGDQLFYQVKNRKLTRWDGAQFRDLSSDPLVSGASIMRLFPAAEGALEGMTSAGAFFRLRGDKVEPIAPEAAASLGKTRIICAIPRPAGRGWYLGTDTAGLLVIDAAGRLARRLGRAEGLVDTPIVDLAYDRAGALWLATFSGPLQIEQPEAVSHFGPAQGMPEASSLGLERHQGRLYVATPSGLLRLMPGESRFEPTPGTPRYPQRIVSTPGGLIVGHSEGLVRLHDDRFATLLESRNAVVSVAVSHRDPALVFAGRSAGFTVLRRSPGDAAPATELHHFPDLGQVRDVFEDEAGAVWLATSTRGIHRLVPGTGDDPWAQPTITTFDTESGRLQGGSDSAVLLPSAYGLLFYTTGGHVRFEAAADRFAPERRFHYAGEPIGAFAVTALHGREMWASTSPGTAKALPVFGPINFPAGGHAELRPLPASVQELLGPVEGGRILIEGAGADLVVWSRTSEGLVRVRPALLTAPPPPQRVRFTQFDAVGTPQPLFARATPRFAYSRQPYVFAFETAQLEHGARIEYQTQLAGWDHAWSAFSPAREARFSSLPAGKYALQVRARDRLGRVSEPATLAFSVRPPPWLSPWAFGGYATALGIGVFGLVRWRVGRLERDRQRLARLVDERTAQLATARDQAEAASRAKSDFLASMSHELRTPLNGVIGYAQVLQGDTRLLPDQQERLRIVRSSGEHLLRMINDVLDLAKIEAGKLELRPAPLPLHDLLRDIAAAHTPAAAAKKLAFTLDAAPDLPAWVEGDAQKLRQILDNLVGNAIKFTAAGSIRLSVTRVAPESQAPEPGASRERIAFAVTDTGAGIAEADQARLFQPFEQAASRGNAPGTGLGLAISRALVERMGGRLALESALGRGSTFAFAIELPPVAAPQSKGTDSLRIVGYEGPVRRVLIVDDHPVNRSLLVDLLQPLGFACAACDSGESALAQLTRPAEPWPDLAILDVRMEGMDGLELTRRLRALPRGPQPRVLLTSASVLTFNPADGFAA